MYDTASSKYVNLDFIKELVMKHKDFRVVDSKSEKDLTKQILLQIISEQEVDDEQALLTNTLLKQLIRFYGSDLQILLRPYLEKSLAAFLERQESMQGLIDGFIDKSTFESFRHLFEENLEAWSRFAFGEKPGKK